MEAMGPRVTAAAVLVAAVGAAVLAFGGYVGRDAAVAFQVVFWLMLVAAGVAMIAVAAGAGARARPR